MVLEQFEDIIPTNFVKLCQQMALWAEHINESSGLPKLELSLHNGRSLYGHVIKYQTFDLEHYVWLQESSDAETRPIVTFLGIKEICAISFIDFNHYLSVLELQTPVKEVGILELKRSIKSTEEQLLQLFEHETPIEVDIEALSDRQRIDVQKVLGILPKIFKSIMSDPLSINLTKSAINLIHLYPSEIPKGASLENKALSIYISSNTTLILAKLKDQLKAEIEALL